MKPTKIKYLIICFFVSMLMINSSVIAQEKDFFALDFGINLNMGHEGATNDEIYELDFISYSGMSARLRLNADDVFQYGYQVFSGQLRFTHYIEIAPHQALLVLDDTVTLHTSGPVIAFKLPDIWRFEPIISIGYLFGEAPDYQNVQNWALAGEAILNEWLIGKFYFDVTSFDHALYGKYSNLSGGIGVGVTF